MAHCKKLFRYSCDTMFYNFKCMPHYCQDISTNGLSWTYCTVSVQILCHLFLLWSVNPWVWNISAGIIGYKDWAFQINHMYSFVLSICTNHLITKRKGFQKYIYFFYISACHKNPCIACHLAKSQDLLAYYEPCQLDCVLNFLLNLFLFCEFVHCPSVCNLSVKLAKNQSNQIWS